MGHSTDFSNQRPSRGSHGQSADSMQEANGNSTDHEYLSILAPSIHGPRLGNSVLHGSDRLCRSSTSYPSPHKYPQYILSDSSVIPSHEVNGPMSASILQGGIN